MTRAPASVALAPAAWDDPEVRRLTAAPAGAFGVCADAPDAMGSPFYARVLGAG